MDVFHRPIEEVERFPAKSIARYQAKRILEMRQDEKEKAKGADDTPPPPRRVRVPRRRR